MSYYLSKTLNNTTVKTAIEKLTDVLKDEGFGIISEINISDTLKKKIDVDYKEYIILGACNPHFAYKAIQSEEKIGLFLPCNIIVVDAGEGNTEVSVIDPVESMSSVKNDKLGEFAESVRSSLFSAINKLS